MSNDPKLLKDLQDTLLILTCLSKMVVSGPEVQELGIKQKHFQQISKLLYDSKAWRLRG